MLLVASGCAGVGCVSGSDLGLHQGAEELLGVTLLRVRRHQQLGPEAAHRGHLQPSWLPSAAHMRGLDTSLQEFGREYRSLCPASHPEFAEDGCDIVLHGLLRENEFCPDLAVRLAFSNAHEDAPLPSGQRLKLSWQRGPA